jgi:hypothetical protein
MKNDLPHYQMEKSYFKWWDSARHRQLMPVILAPQEAEFRRIAV